MVATTIKRITVMLSTNMDSRADRTMKHTSRGTGRNRTFWASHRLIQSKKPASLISSTMIIMPDRKRMVLQLTPVLNSVMPMWENQNSNFRKLFTLRASHTAAGLPMDRRKTSTIIKPPADRVTRCRGYFPQRTRMNMTTAMAMARI